MIWWLDCPGAVSIDQCVCQDDKLSGDGDEGDFGKFAVVSQALIEVAQCRVVPGSGEGGEVEDVAYTLSLKQVRRIITRVTEAERCGDLLYQAPGGHPRLKSELGRYLAERDIPLSDDLDILVTNGAQHGLDIFARSFVSRTGVAAVESPSLPLDEHSESAHFQSRSFRDCGWAISWVQKTR